MAKFRDIRDLLAAVGDRVPTAGPRPTTPAPNPERLCIVCGWRRARTRERCRTCYAYLREHGHDRPEDLVVAHGRRVEEKSRRGNA